MSLLPGFEYDIFISYRHNDNRSGWVTELLKNLQEELATILKDPVSIYFDTNPHDGLLETHHVDKSLEGKLKCLIFIPILSQTYCDPKSFAWRHEFCAFNKLAKEDQFGRDIKLASGNVASRILPVRIHELDAEDKSVIENEIGGILRAIEFIYKEPGVNRPLKSTDSKNDNQNKTDYRNQVNKVANAVKEIIYAIKNPGRTSMAAVNRQPAVIPPKAKKKYILAVLALAILVIAGYLLYPKFESVAVSRQSAGKSIAVLPFVNLSDDPEQEYFSEGMMEEILNQLSKIAELKVTSRTSSMLYKNSTNTLKEIAGKLNVNNILEGSVQKYGSKVRITVQLINARTDKHIWSETFDREMQDIFTIQTDIAIQVAKSLKARLSSTEKDQLEKTYTRNMEAYQFYLKGRFHWNKRKKDELKKGITYFEQAVEIDSLYALPYAGLGDSYLIMGAYGILPPDESFPMAKKYTEKALQLDPHLAEAYATLTDINIHFDWNAAMAEQNFQKAISYNPNYANAYHWHSELLSIQKKYEDAIHDGQTALEIEPFSVVFNTQLGTDYWFNGDTEKAIQQYQKTLALDSTFSGTHYYLCMAYIGIKQFDKALYHCQKARESDPDNDRNLAIYAYVLGITGKKQEAGRIEHDLLVKVKVNYVSPYELAIVALGLGKNESALEYLEQAFTERCPWMPFLEMNPLFEPLREYPKFKSILSRIKLQFDEGVHK